MKTNTKNVNGANNSTAVLENGKEVFNAGMNESSGKKGTANVNQAAAIEDSVKKPTLEDLLYKAMQEVTLFGERKTVSVEALLKMSEKELQQFKAAANMTKAERAKANRKALLSAALRTFAAFPASEEKNALRNTLRARWKYTNGYSVTFVESETAANGYETKETATTPAAIRTAFNSVDIARRAKARAKKANELQQARELLLNLGMPEKLLNLFPDAQIIAVANKLQA